MLSTMYAYLKHRAIIVLTYFNNKMIKIFITFGVEVTGLTE